MPLGAAAWVSLEYLRGSLFGGFPWIPLGNTMVTLLPIAQLASVVGVYALSLFVALVNAGFALVIVSAPPRPAHRARGHRGCWSPSSSVWGGLRLAANTLVEGGTPVRVGLIQANIAQVDKWNDAQGRPDRRALPADDAAGGGRGAELVLWPESSTPFFFDEEPVGEALVRGVVQSTGVPLLFGTDEIERGAPNRYYNSAFMLDTRRRHGGGLPQDAPGAVRRVRAVQGPAVLRAAAGRIGVGLHARRRSSPCCRSTGT